MYKCFMDIECSRKLYNFYSAVNECFVKEIDAARESLNTSTKNTIECDASKWHINHKSNDAVSIELFVFYVLYELKKNNIDIGKYDDSIDIVTGYLYDMLETVDDFTALTIEMLINNIYNCDDGGITYIYHLIIPSSKLIDPEVTEKAKSLAKNVNLNMHKIINSEFTRTYM